MHASAYALPLLFLPSLALALYGAGTDVVELNPGNFERLVTDSESVWIIEFYAPWCGHCQQLVPEYKKAASALKGVVKVGAINGDEHKSLFARFQGRGFPTIKIFADDKKNPSDYQGPRTAQGFADEAIRMLQAKVQKKLGGKSSGSGGRSGGSGGGKPGDDVVELTDSNFDSLVLNNGRGSEQDWLVEFYAPWCGHCKNLAPHWAKAATELRGKVKLGALDATVHNSKSGQYGVSGFPTIKFFPKGSKSVSDAEDYPGGRTADAIVEFALSKFDENVPPPDVLELTDQEILETACSQQLCVLSVLPQLLDCQSTCRKDYVKMLKAQAEKFKKNKWGWLWTEALAHPSLEEAFEIGGFGYPAMVVVNTRKEKFSTLRGSFDETGIHEFLRDLTYGRGSTSTLRQSSLPKIKKVSAWDGKDGAMPEEEDIDLSDVELDDLEPGKTEL